MGFYYEDIRARYAVLLHTEHTTVSTYFTIPDSHRRGTATTIYVQRDGLSTLTVVVSISLN